MASSSSQPEQQYFSVTPKNDCPHIQVIKQTDKLEINISAPCLTCENIGENWLCLVCSEVFCSRFVKEHMVRHFEKSGHAVALSFSDLSCWCFECDSYITSPLLKGVLKAAELAKFDSTSEKQTMFILDQISSQCKKETEMSSSEGKTTSNPRSIEASLVTSTHGIPSKKEDVVEGACGPINPSVKEVKNQTHLVNQIKGVIYGNCIGDAIGLLTEFMNKDMAKECYGGSHSFKGICGSTATSLNLEYSMKVDDRHRNRWVEGDWTDDSDQMILILQTLVENHGQFKALVFAAKLKYWEKNGYPELGDFGGCGLGSTTNKVLRHLSFLDNPHNAARQVWENSGKFLAPNGGVMRTSILGTMEFHDLEKVIGNTKNACMVTHADPRCVASCVAVTVAIALMLQGKYTMNNGKHDVDSIMKDAHDYAQQELIGYTEHKKEFTKHMFAESLQELELDDAQVIGYTLKCLGAGFWAFRQKDFRKALQKLTMEGGDADTNGAVAGALLGCKVGFDKLPESWKQGLAHRGWLENNIQGYLALLGLKYSTN